VALPHRRYSPYFLVRVKQTVRVPEVEDWLGREFGGLVSSVTVVNKEDLDLPNHLSGLLQPYVKLSFRNVTDLMSVRKVILPAVATNKRRAANAEAYENIGMVDANAAAAGASTAFSGRSGGRTDKRRRADQILDSFVDIREYDVPFTQRVQIDLGLRVGLWYEVRPEAGSISCDFTERKDLVGRPLMKVLAFDIETAKAPLKFPNPEVDRVIMISLMLDGKGLLIVNRDVRIAPALVVLLAAASLRYGVGSLHRFCYPSSPSAPAYRS